MKTLRYDITPDGCWTWAGQIDREGYGRTGGELAHRVAYQQLIGGIGDGLTLDHLCRNRACVNPAHLEPVTIAENIARGVRPRPTHCKHGHEFTTENTYVIPYSGHRQCRACGRLRWRLCKTNKAIRADRARYGPQAREETA